MKIVWPLDQKTEDLIGIKLDWSTKQQQKKTL